MTLTQMEAMRALLQNKIITCGDVDYALNSGGELMIRYFPWTTEPWQISNLFAGAEIKPEWDLSFEDALADMRAGKICQCEIAPEFNFWMNDKGRIIAGEPTARLGPKANGHIVELCDDHFTARWRVVR